MLGDSGSEKRNLKSNTRLQFKQSIQQIEYVEHLYTLLQDYCSSPPIILTQNSTCGAPHPRAGSTVKKFKSIKFSTRSLPCFNEFRELFYNENGVKYIPKNIGNYLTPVVLAYWFQDDGYKAPNGFYFSSESFTEEENHL